DVEDYDIVSNKRWAACVNTNTGATFITDPSGKMLHHLIMSVPKGYEIDHRDLNTLNNCKSNLHICSHRENQCNQPLQSNNTSGVTGVIWNKNRKTWNAVIKHFEKSIHLGAYHLFVEAVQARNEGMRWLFKEFGRYNDVPEAPQWIKDKVAEICNKAI
ncbi:MAG: HNH endonuclease, partial [Oscillospiraceae bacterium]|nr:HNH endonuclease [Oscillospiraceae bacterium]